MERTKWYKDRAFYPPTVSCGPMRPGSTFGVRLNNEKAARNDPGC